MLSKRLNAVASFVPKGAQAIDIGCDHGYLGIYLTKEGLVKSIILTDIKESALNQAKKNILKAKLDIKTILTNGLENVNTNDLDTIIISGMGTKTIIDILNTGCLDRIENLVLSSNNNLYNPFSVKSVDLNLTCGFLPYEAGVGVYGVPNSGFAVTNVALKGITEIKITDNFSIPVFAQAIWNPRMEDAHLVFGFTLRP